MPGATNQLFLWFLNLFHNPIHTKQRKITEKKKTKLIYALLSHFLRTAYTKIKKSTAIRDQRRIKKEIECFH